MLAEKTSTGLEICEGQLLMVMSVVDFLRMKMTVQLLAVCIRLKGYTTN